MIIDNPKRIVQFLLDKTAGSVEMLARQLHMSPQTIYRAFHEKPISNRSLDKLIKVYCFYKAKD